jgi:hypothetical protein
VTLAPVSSRVTVTVFPRQLAPIAARSLPHAAATIEPGGYL